MAKKSKGYKAAVEKITEEQYAPLEAFELLKEIFVMMVSLKILIVPGSPFFLKY